MLNGLCAMGLLPPVSILNSVSVVRPGSLEMKSGDSSYVRLGGGTMVRSGDPTVEREL